MESASLVGIPGLGGSPLVRSFTVKKVHRFTVGLVLAGMVVFQLYVAMIAPSSTPTFTPPGGTCNEVHCGDKQGSISGYGNILPFSPQFERELQQKPSFYIKTRLLLYLGYCIKK
jgi:hypothetical protein